MSPFEIKEPVEVLRDANDKPMEVLPVPGEDVLEQLTVQMIHESQQERIRCITNVQEAAEDEVEGWRFSDVPAQVTKLTVEKVMTELTGEGWFDYTSDDGYSVGETIDLLSQKTFVQLSRLTVANVKACLSAGGKLIAYFPDLVWREYFHLLPSWPTETLGMRTVEIVKVTETDEVWVHDHSTAHHLKRLDKGAFEWLSKGGWMLEVYK